MTINTSVVNTDTVTRVLKLCAVALAVITFAATLTRGGAQSNPAAPAQAAPAQATKPLDPQQKLAELNKQIEGQETKPAEVVFKNIQMLKGMPARRLLLVMNAYARALGVDCAHCHTIDQWERDNKPTKQTARDMMRMVAGINNDYIKAMKNVAAGAAVNCSTCHRGQPHPDSRLPEAKTK
jgi:hypothetical protein